MHPDSFLTRRANGAVWVCLRPRKAYSRLRVSIQVGGATRLPLLLDPQGQPGKVERDDDGRVWYSGLPEVGTLRERAIEDHEWLFGWLGVRTQVFESVRRHIERLEDSHSLCGRTPTTEFLVEMLTEWRRQHNLCYHLILLVALIVDEIGELFFEHLAQRVGNELALRHITDLFRTPYAIEARETGGSFAQHGDTYAHSANLTIPKAHTNLCPKSEWEGNVVSRLLAAPLSQRAEAWRRYAALRPIAPILVQVNDEQAYLWRAQTRLIMSFIRAYERRVRVQTPHFQVTELTIDELLTRLERERLQGAKG